MVRVRAGRMIKGINQDWLVLDFTESENKEGKVSELVDSLKSLNMNFTYVEVENIKQMKNNKELIDDLDLFYD